MNILVCLLFFTSIINIEGKPNILFIIVDDLRPALGCYGDANAYTPNIDNFAKKSITFTQAFAQQSLCAPSRNSLLTARRPDTLHLYDFYSYWRNVAGNFTTLPEHLKSLGYTTMSVGKVFHPGISSNGSDDCPYSWSSKPFHPLTDSLKNAAVCPVKNATRLYRNLICPVQVSSMPRKTLPDLETLNEANKFLRKNNNDEKPFFLAVGFQKPHVPLKYPRKYLKFHPLSKFKMTNYSWPKHINSVAYNPWNDLRKREDVKSLNLNFPWQKIPVNFAKKIVQSYYAAVTYVDDLIGRLLNQLSKLNLVQTTAVIITSDHGWSLGEHAEWSKYSNFDVALRVPLIMSIPGLTHYSKSSKQSKLSNNILHDISNDKSADIKENDIRNQCVKDNFTINEVVELIDLFPTIVNIAGDSIPICPLKENFFMNDNSSVPNLCSEGLSLMSLITSKISCKNNTWKNFAFSQYPRPGIEPSIRPNSDEPRLKDINIMGYSLRTETFRYVAWVRFDHVVMKPIWNEIIEEELYDHSFDPKEYSNVIDHPRYQQQKQVLQKILQNGWRSKL